MDERASDMGFIYEQLDRLEKEIRHLRESLRPYDISGTISSVRHPYVESVSTILSGEPIIVGTRTPVRAIVEYWKFGVTPEEIARRLPHLRLAQIFDALAYYDDNRQEIEAYIARNRVPVDE